MCEHDREVFEVRGQEIRVVTDEQECVVSFNGVAERLLDARCANALGRSWRALLAEGAAAPIDWARVARGEPVEIARSGRILSIQRIHQREDRAWWVGQDVTPYRQKIEDLEHIGQFFDHSGDSILIHDRQGRILRVNDAMTRNLGYTREQLLALHVYDVEMSVKPGSLTGIWDRMVPGEAITIQGTQRRSDGSLIPVEVRLGLFESRGELLVCAVARDVSAHRYTENQLRALNEQLEQAHTQALTASQAKSSFLANMSHEFRTPLNAIIGYSEIITEDLGAVLPQHSETLSDLHSVLVASNHLLNLINNLLDLSKIEAGKFEVDIETIDPITLVDEVARVIDPMARQRGNTIAIHDETHGRAASMRSDRLKLKQVVFNLLSNAAKFCASDTSIDVHVRLFEPSHGATRVRISVEDCGAGIADHEIERLFQPFEQSDSATHKSRQGTGLGLPISRRLCQLLDGDLSATSEVGHGSVFCIDLPLVYQDDDKEMRESATRLSPHAPSALIVTSDETIAAQFSQQAAGVGYRASRAVDRREVITIAHATRPRHVTVDASLYPEHAMDVVRSLQQNPAMAPLSLSIVGRIQHERRGWCLHSATIIALPASPNVLVQLLARRNTNLARAITNATATQIAPLCDGDIPQGMTHLSDLRALERAHREDPSRTLIAHLDLGRVEDIEWWLQCERTRSPRALAYWVVILSESSREAIDEASTRAASLWGEPLYDIWQRLLRDDAPSRHDLKR